MKKILVIFILITHHFAVAQNEGNIWHFGSGAGLDFNNGAPIALTNGVMYTTEGCATICDTSGSLLFYTDGTSVWNRNHITMPNGLGLAGGSSSTQSAIIVPQPGSNNIFYIFTVGQQLQTAGLQYSVVDMNLSGGLGNVTGIKNILLATPTCEKLTAVKHQNGQDYWIICRLFGSNVFNTYLLTSAGLNTTPVVTAIGGVIVGASSRTIGYFKASPNGIRLAMANTNLHNVEVFDFDNSTGILSNVIALTNNTRPYGVEFSPNSNILYVGQEKSPFSSIFQYDLLAGSAVNIQNSRTVIGMASSWCGALQLGPDEKIYHARYNIDSLGLIRFPNILGNGCQYDPDAIHLMGRVSRLGLPNIFSPVTPSAFTFNYLCFGDSTEFLVPNILSVDSVFWNFGDSISGLANTSTLLSPKHQFSDTGTFVVSLSSYSGSTNFTIIENVTIIPNPSFTLGADTSLCAGDQITLNPGINAASYVWHDGTSNQTFTASSQGTYWLLLSKNGCSAKDSITITFQALPQVDIGADTSLCQGEQLIIGDSIGNAQYQWQDSSTSNFFVVNQSGIYWLELTLNLCKNRDSVNVLINPIPSLSLGSDTSVCLGDQLLLHAGSNHSTYSWQDSSTDSTLLVTQSGTYWVHVTLNNCSNSDSINVTTNMPPPLDLGSDSTLCPGQSLWLNAVLANSSYLWQDSSVSSFYNISSPGTYWLELTKDNCSIRDSVIVNFENMPLLNLGPDTTLCENEILTLNASAPNVSYLWNDQSTNSSLSVSTPGIYSVQILKNNCSISDSINVNYQQLPIVYLGPDTVLCPGDNLTLDVINPNSSYLWQDSSINSTYNVVQSGQYWAYVTIGRCVSSDSLYVSYHTLPTIDLGSDTTLCDGESIILDVLTNNATYNWQDNSSQHDLLVTSSGTYWVEVKFYNCTVTDSISIDFTVLPIVDLGEDTTLCDGQLIKLKSTLLGATYVWSDSSTNAFNFINAPGVYWVVVSVDRCSSSDSILIDYDLLPVVHLGNDTILCDGDSIILSSALSNGSYLWQNGSTSETYTVYTAGTYEIETTVRYCSNTDEVIIDYITEPRPDLGDDQVICYGTPYYIDATSTFGTNYIWNNGSTTTETYVNYPGLYIVNVSNKCGSNSDSISVDFEDCYCDLFVPNAFTPDGDGRNEYFSPVFNCDFSKFKMQIFNRWGHLLFESSDPLHKWDGTFQGAMSPTGQYIYQLTYKFDSGYQSVKNGSISLLR